MRQREPYTLIAASHPEELQELLRQMDVSVPLRSDGRTKGHVEIYAIAHLLASLSPDYFRFPIEVVHRERPDFILRTRGNNIGVEHVEVIPKNEAWMARLREEGHGPDVHFVRHAAIDEPVKSRDETIEEIEADEAGDGWTGDSAEKEWAEAMLHHALLKVDRLGQPGFEQFDETWLLMYDNWPLPVIDPRKAAAFLLAHSQMSTVLERFRRVLVMDGQRVWEFTRQGAFHPLARDLKR